MKKIICLIIATVLCVAMFTGCEKVGDAIEGVGIKVSDATGKALNSAIDSLCKSYEDLSGTHSEDFEVMGSVNVNGTKYAVTWTADNDLVTIRESVKIGKYTVDLPGNNEEEFKFTLTATVSSASGKRTRSTTFEITVPAAAAANTLSIADAIDLGKAQGTGKYTTEKYFVSGTVGEFYGNAGTTYGNFYITDDSGNQILIYGLYDATGATRYDAMANAPKTGDTVTVWGVVGNYNGTPQIKNGWLTAHNGTQLGNPSQDNNTGNNSGNTGNGGSTGGSGLTDGTTLVDASTLDENTTYYISSLTGNGDVYFSGSVENGRITGSTSVSSAVAVKLESAGADGEYYIYFMNGSAKTYIGVNTGADTGAAAFVLGTEKSDDYVWILSTSDKTIVSKAFGTRGIGTKTAETKYTTLSTYATSNFGQSDYDAAWLAVVDNGSTGGSTGGTNNGGTTGGNTGNNNTGSGNNNSGNTNNGGTSTGSKTYSLDSVFTATLQTTENISTSDGVLTFQLVSGKCGAGKGQLRVYANNSGVIQSSVAITTFTFTANGKSSGEATVKVEYSTDGSNWVTATDSLVITSSATNTVTFNTAATYIRITSTGKQLQVTEITIS